MGDLLSPIRITSIKTTNPEDSPVDLKLSSVSSIRAVEETPAKKKQAKEHLDDQQLRKPKSAEETLEILRSEPSLSELSLIFDFYLNSNTSGGEDGLFDVKSINPLTSRIINTLIVDTIPSVWGIYTYSTSHKADKKNLLQCVRSVSGIGGLVARSRLLLKQINSSQPTRARNFTVTKINPAQEAREGILVQIRDLMDVASSLLRGHKIVKEFWVSLKHMSPSKTPEDRKLEMAWKEFVSLVAGGKLLSVAAEADILLQETEEALSKRKSSWLGSGKDYTIWLRDNISVFLDDADVNESSGWKAIAEVITRGLSLGYNDHLIDARLHRQVSDISIGYLVKIRLLLSHLKDHERRTYVNTLLKLLSQKYLQVWTESDEKYNSRIRLVGKIIHDICVFDGGLKKGYQDILLDWILVNGGPGAGEPVGIRRAVIAAIHNAEEGPQIIRESLESQVDTFAENLWIRNAPVFQQEVNAQCLLICAGYVDRSPPSYLKILARTSAFMSGISNHLATTNTRIRFLGMVVGETMSNFVDAQGKKLSFKDSMEASDEEVLKWKSLSQVNDQIPGYEIFLDESLVTPTLSKPTPKKPSSLSSKKPAIVDLDSVSTKSKAVISGSRIQELSDSDSDSDESIKPIPKGFSDHEDSDSDPTLINRKKVQPPVYIRDLLYLLTETESYDKQKMGLTHAAVLIRRKATFGTELSSHAAQILDVLTGMQDKYDMENFENMRLKALVSLTVSLPLLTGPWLSQRIFDGEFSLAQRCVILSAIGIAATELAGEELPDDSPLLQFQLSTQEKEKASFPSRRLPKRLHDVYASTPVDNISKRLKDSILQPIAADAADQVTGPSILKVRKFSTRMEVEARKKKPGVNKLANIVVPAFFGPLVGRWWVFVKDYGGTRSSRLIPHLLAMYVKTLTVLLHSTGGNSLVIRDIIDGFWDLLLGLTHVAVDRGRGVEDGMEEGGGNGAVVDAVLIGFLTMFDVVRGRDEEGRRMAVERGKELVETQEWVAGVFERTGESEADGRKGLAAAVLLRCREVVQKYERLLMGDLIG